MAAAHRSAPPKAWPRRPRWLRRPGALQSGSRSGLESRGAGGSECQPGLSVHYQESSSSACAALDPGVLPLLRLLRPPSRIDRAFCPLNGFLFFCKLLSFFFLSFLPFVLFSFLAPPPSPHENTPGLQASAKLGLCPAACMCLLCTFRV